MSKDSENVERISTNWRWDDSWSKGFERCLCVSFDSRSSLERKCIWIWSLVTFLVYKVIWAWTVWLSWYWGSFPLNTFKVLVAVKELFGLDFDSLSNLDLQKLKEEMESVHFRAMDSIARIRLNYFLSLFISINDLQKHTSDWDNILDTCMEKLEVIEQQHSSLPSIAIDEHSKIWF